MTEREREMRNSKSPGPVGSRRSRRRTAPYWTKRGDANSATRRAVRDYIESPAEVARYREINLRALRAARQLPRLYRAILYCSAVDPCRESLCPHCTSDYRLWLAPELIDSRAAWASRLCRHSLVAVGARARSARR